MKDNGHLSPSQRALGVEIPSVIALDYTGLNLCSPGIVTAVAPSK